MKRTGLCVALVAAGVVGGVFLLRTRLVPSAVEPAGEGFPVATTGVSSLATAGRTGGASGPVPAAVGVAGTVPSFTASAGAVRVGSSPVLFDPAAHRRFEASLGETGRARLVRLKARSVLVDPLPAARAAAAAAEFYVKLDPDRAAVARSGLESSGVRFHDYIADSAWRVTVPAGVPDAHLAPAGVVGWAAVLPEDKFSPGVWKASRAGGKPEPRPFVVGFGRGCDPAVAAAVVAAVEGRLETAAPDRSGRARLVIDPAKLPDLARRSEVSFIELPPPPIRKVNATAAALAGANLVQAAPYNLTGSGIVVAVRDGGAIFAHGDFGSPARLQVIDAVPADEHATHVAGTIAGSGAGSAAARGLAPGAHLLSYDFDGSFAGELIDARSRGARLSNHSYGHVIGWVGTVAGWIHYGNETLFGDYTSDAADLDLVIRDQDLTVVKAAGNDRNDTGSGPEPADGIFDGDGQYDCLDDMASGKNTITVGAIMDDLLMTEFSGWGPTDDGRVKPDLVANGHELWSTINAAGAYASMSGTSMASPATCGALALLMEQYRTLHGGNHPPASLAKALVLATTRDLGRAGPDYQNGWGAINIKDAIDVLRSPVSLVAHQSISQGQTLTHPVSVTNGMKLRVALVWTDREASPVAAKALVNDLDLVVVSPSGVTNRPFVLPFATGGASRTNLAVRGTNDTDNVEQVEVTLPENGVWTVRVAGRSIPIGPQSYSVVGWMERVLDRCEPNDTPESATRIGSAPGIHLRGVGLHGIDDFDHFRFDILRTNSVSIRVAARTNLLLDVYTSATGLLASASVPAAGGTGTVGLASLVPGTYLLRVWTTNEPGTNGVYTLDIETNAPGATRVLYVNPPGVTNSATNSFYTLAMGSDTNDGLTPFTPKATVGALLAAYALGSNDHVVIDSGAYSNDWTVTAADAGAAYAGVPGRTVFSSAEGVSILFDAADDQVLHDFSFTGPGRAVELANSDRNVLEQLTCRNQGVAVKVRDVGGSPSSTNLIRNCLFDGFNTAVEVRNSPGNLIVSNTISPSGSYGLYLSAGGANEIRDNTFDDATYAIYFVEAAHDLVRGNRIAGGGTYGIAVDRAQQIRIETNAISGRAFGVYAGGFVASNMEAIIRGNTISNALAGVYFYNGYIALTQVRDNTIRDAYNYGIYAPASCFISGNDVAGCGMGIRYDGPALGLAGNRLHHNVVGLGGQGFLGAADWGAGQPNDIHTNGTGVLPLGGAPVQFNRIHGNGVGVAVGGVNAVHHNLLYDNTNSAVLVEGSPGASIYNNTIYAPQGDGIRLRGGSEDVTLKNNIVWTLSGYGLNVDTDSQRGFASDYNNLYASGDGRLVRWQKDFADLVDWQIEANLDNHSIGYTAVAPTLDQPRFEDLTNRNLRLQSGSTSIDAGDLEQPVTLEPQPNGNRVNLGAYGETALAETSTAAFVTLLYPEYYTDWSVNEGRAILWTNCSVVGNVDLDLYRDGYGKVADIAIVPVTNGLYAWSPQDSGVAGDTTNRYRIRIASATNAALFDVSREGFSIPAPGGLYYVNDTNTANDEFCLAPGNNRNTGRTPSDPKSVLLAHLRSYSLRPGDTVKVDDGRYLHVRNVVISATPGTGDDQGFVLTGPTGVTRTALFDRANTNDEATAVDVNGASYVTMTRLTVEGGNRGVWVRNGSAHFTGSHLLLVSNTLDGIRVESGATGLKLSDLQAVGNGDNGIYVGTPIDSITNCIARRNADCGIFLVDVGGTRVERCTASENGYGIHIANGIGATATVGSLDLPAGLGNAVFSNAVAGIQGQGPVLVAGNTVFGHRGLFDLGISMGSGGRVARNVVFGNHIGIQASGSDVEENRVYANEVWGIQATDANLRRNAVYSNGGGISFEGLAYPPYFTVAQNLVYANTQRAFAAKSSGPLLQNNTFYQPQGNAVELSGCTRIDLRNNIIQVLSGYGLYVAPDSQSGFVSDYNLLLTNGTGRVGYWQAADRTSLAAWRIATFRDANSAAQDPLFVDPDGADNLLGALGGSDGRDDDFHVQSQFGTFSGAALAPVRDAGSGLPVFLATNLTMHAAQSPAIDRGDASSGYALEPAPNGGFVNLGAYGNTPQASKSPSAYILLLSPDGGEVWPAAQTFPIRWRSHDANGTVTIDLLRNGSVLAGIATNVPNSGSHAWTVPAVAPSNTYQVRIQRNGPPVYTDTSAAFFSITNPISLYYVNDTNLNASGDWTTATGNDANDGLTPATPKASIRSVLETYDLGPGDTILVDAGVYHLTDNMIVTAGDAGARIEGYHDAAYPGRHALLDRGDRISPTAAALAINGADDVTVARLRLTGGYRGIAVSNDADGVTIEACHVYGNSDCGVNIMQGCETAVVSACEVFGLPGGDPGDEQPHGIQIEASFAQVLGNRVFDNGIHGIRIVNPGPPGTVGGVRADGNTVTGNGLAGIYLEPSGTQTCWITRNLVSSNALDGIVATMESCRVDENTVSGHGSAGGAGIRLFGGALARTNVVHDNHDGIAANGRCVVEDCRVYRNRSRGIWLKEEAANRAERNRVYGNGWGIEANGQEKRIVNNLVYANTNGGVLLNASVYGADVANNTIFQPQGDAVRVSNNCWHVRLRNNVLWSGAGFDLNVAADSQTGFSSDYNLLHATGRGALGLWQGTAFASLTDWVNELGFDAHSRAVDPQFTDPDGLDNVLGFDAANGTDGGVDDNFRLQTGSPGIDGGDVLSLWLREPWPNGERINQGAYGNTPLAEPSPAAFVQVLYPNGREKFELNEPVEVRWRSSGLGTNWCATRMKVAGPPAEAWPSNAYETTTFHTSYVITNAIDTNAIARPAPVALYRSGQEQDLLAWQLPVPDGDYVVRLHWAEPLATLLAGMRTFDVRLQGVTVDDNLDVTLAAGATLRAFARSYSVTAAGGSGIALVLAKDGGTHPALLSGIEVTAAHPGGATGATVRVEFSSDGGGAYATVATSAAVDAQGNGGVIWTAAPATVGNSGFIRVTTPPGGGVQDVSDAGFLVANGGTNYYVNDASSSNDVFCTAIGNNANSGKSPSEPMASLSALLEAYAPGTGDVVHIDTGHYNLLKNARITAGGVRIEGPVGPVALINRSNLTLGSSAVIEIDGADDVTVARLWLTGGNNGVSVVNDADRAQIDHCVVQGNNFAGVQIDAGCDAPLVGGCEVRGLPAGSAFDDQQYGIILRANDGLLEGNTIANNALRGIQMEQSAVQPYLVRARARGNTVHGSAEMGIYLSALGTQECWVSQNTVYSNGVEGIFAVNPMARVDGNTVFGHAAGTGIRVDLGARARTNIVSRNLDGLVAGGGGRLEDNRVFYNSNRGLYLTHSGRCSAERNRVYSNGWGIEVTSADQYIANNVVYANVNGGIRLVTANRPGVMNNTIYQPLGDALQAVVGTIDARVRNSVLWALAGYAIHVAPDSQAGFGSDYNILHTTGTGKVGLWQGAPFAGLNDWNYELGLDVHSRAVDPLFIDRDGADNVLGYDDVSGLDRGADDNFRLQPASSGIDGGDLRGYWLREPWPNGGRLNQGAYGNTAEAEPSAEQLVQVLYPNGRDKFELGDQVQVQWRAAGLATNRQVARINVGGPDAGTWLANAYQVATVPPFAISNAIDTGGATSPAPAAVYQTGQEMDGMRWELPVPNGVYALRLHWAEPYAGTPPGGRVFDVYVQDALVDDDVDIRVLSGSAFKAVTRAYAVTASGGAGIAIELRREASSSYYPVLSGIEVSAAHPGGFASPSVNVAYSADGGGSFLPVAANLALDLDGLGSTVWTAAPATVGNSGLMRASALQGTNPVDLSDAPFLVANAGTNYYVNDPSASNDVFCSAVGNNANSGKDPAEPMASLPALLATYLLGTGDVVHVDTGTYNLLKNARVTSSGLRIEGPPGQTALLSRSNLTLSGSTVLAVDGADDLTLSRLALTGGYVGLAVSNDADRVRIEDCVVFGNNQCGILVEHGSDAALISGCSVHGTPGGASEDNQYFGILLQGDDGVVLGNEVRHNSYCGIAMEAYPALVRARAEQNSVYGNGNIGIYLDAKGNQECRVVRNTVFANTAIGITAYNPMARIDENIVHGHGAGGAGIRLGFGAVARSNEVYNNFDGVLVGNDCRVENCRIFHNASRGVHLTYTYQGYSDTRAAVRNWIYSNGWGIEATWGRPAIENNVVYANALGGILLNNTTLGATLANNTVYQSIGDAIRIANASVNTEIRNNILWVGAGYDLQVASDSQNGLQSDYNVFHLDAGPNGRIGRWNGTDHATLASWQAASGGDARSVQGDPLLTDRDGADDVLGYSTAGGDEYDGGRDDRFQTTAGAPGIDRGTVWGAPATDIVGLPRRDDPGAANVGRSDYGTTNLGSSFFAATGTARGWRSCCGAYWTYSLPFAFPFYDSRYTTLHVSSGGFLQFGDPPNVSEPANSLAGLRAARRIAPLWDNLRTDLPGDDIYIDTTVTNRVVIRWNASTGDTGSDVNTAVTLFEDGRIQFHYGAANTNLTPTIGISRGDGVAYTLAAHDGQAILTHSNSLGYFLTATGIVDVGAYEYQGSGGDTNPPRIVATAPDFIHTNGASGTAIDTIGLALSEPVDPVQAVNALAYQLLRDSDGNAVFTGGDALIPLAPSYTALSSNIALACGGPLATGLYQITVYSNRLSDLAQLQLDGDSDGVPGGNYVRTFTLTAQGIEAQTTNVVVPEGATATFGLRLRTAPVGTVVVTTEVVSGDADITIQSGAVLSFHASNWTNFQPVTLAAAEDVDVAAGIRSLRAVATGWSAAQIQAVEADNDLRIVLGTTAPAIAEGSNRTFMVALGGLPAHDETVTVSRISGDASLAVQGATTFVFAVGAWSNAQTVTIAAAADADADDGVATFQFAIPGWPATNLVATELDDDRAIVATPTALGVPEGGSAVFRFHLLAQPAAGVTVTVARVSGDADLTLGPPQLAFDSINWSADQTVTVFAAEDTDFSNGTAAVTATSPGWRTNALVAGEMDNDLAPCLPATNNWPTVDFVCLGLVNADVIFNRPLGLFDDTLQTGVDGANSLATRTAVSNRLGAAEAVPSLPDDGFFPPAASHFFAVDLGWNNEFNGDNAFRIAGTGTVAFAVPTGRYDRVDLFGVASSDAVVTVTMQYQSGPATVVSNAVLNDWFDDGAELAAQPQGVREYALMDDLDRFLNDASGVTTLNDPAIRGLSIPADGTRLLTNVVVAKGNDGASALSLFGATPALRVADLALTVADAPDPALAGGNITWTLLVSNRTLDVATGVTVTNRLPAGVSLVSATSSLGTCSGTTDIVCTLGALGIGQVATVTIVGVAGAIGVYTNAAAVSSVSTETNAVDNAATAVTTVHFPLQILTGSLPTGTVGVAYSTQLSATGLVGGFSWSIVGGSLATGLTFGTNGLLSGTPLAPGSQPLDFRVTDAAGSNATRMLTLVILSAGIPDTDGDGLPDWWETLRGLNPAVSNGPTANADGDWMTDVQEYVADTQPTNGASFFPSITRSNAVAGTMTLVINPTSTNRVYGVHWSTNLPSRPQTWTPLLPEVTGSGSAVSFTITNAVQPRAYRTSVRLP